MALASGTKLGPYEIQSPLGAGGMGEVYRATDTRLDRTVAIKVLASHLSSSPELKQRMEREARAISSLNHPHICHLYDIGSQDGTDYLVMELLEGESLAQRLLKGPLPLRQTLEYGIEIAEALEKAHNNGIVHRDLKPANIMLTKTGAKLMDFGLAKGASVPAAGAAGSAPAFTATLTISSPSPLTTAGTIVGTIQYMSPEQIQGKEADGRSDIFALGAVLYEMATGKRAFEGKSQLSVASAILDKEPESIIAVYPMTPPVFEHVVRTCLAKAPDDRFQTAHDVRLELKWIAETSAAVAPATQDASPRPRRERLAWTVALIAVAIVAALTARDFMSRPQTANVVRTVITPPPNTSMALMGDFAGPPVLSPDGRYLAFSATGKDGKLGLWVRPMDAEEARLLPDTENAIFPFWSPDSRSLGFFADEKLKIIEREGGTPLVLADAPNGRGGAWTTNGVILFTPDTTKAMWQVSASGGKPVALTHIDPGKHSSHRWPFVLPDGKHFLYVAINHDPSKAEYNAIYFASLDGKESSVVTPSNANAIYSEGYLLFAHGTQLMAQPFDAERGKLRGQPQRLASSLANDPTTWHMDASASNTGLLVMGSGGEPDWEIVWYDRNGNKIETAADKLPNLQIARISPQDDRVALQLDVGVNDVWVQELRRGIRTRLTFGPSYNGSPVWSADGKWIAYAARVPHGNGVDLHRKRADGSGAEEILYSDDKEKTPTSWSADGKYLIYDVGPANVGGEIWALPLEGEHKPFLVVANGPNWVVSDGQISPNGRWLAYFSTETGVPQVYVIPFPGGQAKWQVSQNQAATPRWQADGKELYLAEIGTSKIVSVSVSETEGGLQFGNPQRLIDFIASQQNYGVYDISPNGKRILVTSASQHLGEPISVIANWTAELKK
jgi:eukaryotic-like serine/threonine-protein kinase